MFHVERPTAIANSCTASCGIYSGGKILEASVGREARPRLLAVDHFMYSCENLSMIPRQFRNPILHLHGGSRRRGQLRLLPCYRALSFPQLDAQPVSACSTDT